VPELLQTVFELGLHLKGVAFHTGSGGVTFEAYDNSFANARKVFDIAREMSFPPMDLLDIGGGFSMVAKE
jgi:diaminopimelate decarboxylase